MQGRPRAGAGAIVAAVAVGLCATAAAVVASAGGWVGDPVAVTLGEPPPRRLWPTAAAGMTAVAAAGAWPLAVVPRSPAIRAAGRAWLAAPVAAGGGRRAR